MDYNKEAQEKLEQGDKLLTRKGLFKKPDVDGAIECYQKAANLFKMAKNYQCAGDAYYKAAKAQMSNKQ